MMKLFPRVLLLLCLCFPEWALSATVEIRSGSKTVRFQVDVAASEAARRQGLMHRKTIPEHYGMLFVYPKEQPVFMWMKNTPAPLDMLFITQAGKIVHIKHSANPHDTTPISSRFPVRYVLEIAGGSAKRHSISVGNHVSVRGYE